MPTQETRSPARLPVELESPRAKLVYLYLATVGETTVGELTDSLHMTRLTAYSILDTLSARELVTREGRRYAVTPR